MKPIIKADGLGKKYYLGPRETVPPTLREAVKNSLYKKMKMIWHNDVPAYTNSAFFGVLREFDECVV